MLVANRFLIFQKERTKFVFSAIRKSVKLPSPQYICADLQTTISYFTAPKNRSFRSQHHRNSLPCLPNHRSRNEPRSFAARKRQLEQIIPQTSSASPSHPSSRFYCDPECAPYLPVRPASAAATSRPEDVMLYAAVLHTTHLDAGAMFRLLDPLNAPVSLTTLGLLVLALCFVSPRVVTQLLIFPCYRLLFGTLYPAYASYKAVRTKNIKEYVSTLWLRRG